MSLRTRQKISLSRSNRTHDGAVAFGILEVRLKTNPKEQPMRKPRNQNLKSNIKCRATRSGRTRSKGPLSIAEIQHVQIDFRESNGLHQKMRSVVVTPPAAWSEVVVAIVGAHIVFGDTYIEDHHFGEWAAFPGVTSSNNRVTVSVSSVLGDKNGDDRWRAKYLVQVMFLI